MFNIDANVRCRQAEEYTLCVRNLVRNVFYANSVGFCIRCFHFRQISLIYC